MSIKVAIAPILKNMDYANSGDIYFILANYWKQYPEYRKFFQDNQGAKFTIVDNGAYEYGKPLEGDSLLDVWKDSKANEVIAPDVEYDFPQTKHLTSKFIKHIEHKFDIDDPLSPNQPPKIQIVLQGENYTDMVNSCMNFVHRREDYIPSYVTSFGIPLYKKNWRDRFRAVRELSKSTDLPFHLLGLHDPIELALYEQDDKVRSADGGFAVKFGCYEVGWKIGGEIPNNRQLYPNDIEKLVADTQFKKDMIDINIQTLMSCARRSDKFLQPGNKVVHKLMMK